MSSSASTGRGEYRCNHGETRSGAGRGGPADPPEMFDGPLDFGTPRYDATRRIARRQRFLIDSDGSS